MDPENLLHARAVADALISPQRTRSTSRFLCLRKRWFSPCPKSTILSSEGFSPKSKCNVTVCFLVSFLIWSSLLGASFSTPSRPIRCSMIRPALVCRSPRSIKQGSCSLGKFGAFLIVLKSSFVVKRPPSLLSTRVFSAWMRAEVKDFSPGKAVVLEGPAAPRNSNNLRSLVKCKTA